MKSHKYNYQTLSSSFSKRDEKRGMRESGQRDYIVTRLGCIKTMGSYMFLSKLDCNKQKGIAKL